MHIKCDPIYIIDSNHREINPYKSKIKKSKNNNNFQNILKDEINKLK